MHLRKNKWIKLYSCQQSVVAVRNHHHPIDTHFKPSVHVYVKVKGKAVPLQAWSGPEGSRKLRFPDFMTTA